MKLRIHRNSIRLRLYRPEVETFGALGRLEEAFEYGPGPQDRLTYGIEAASDIAAVQVRVSGNRIQIVLPAETAREWTNSDQVQVRAETGMMSVLVEKEFRRLHGANKDPDLYPNPLEVK